MLKIIATISDYGAAVHIGGGIGQESYIIDVPTKNIPEKLKEYLANINRQQYSTISLSIVKEDG